MRRFLASFLAVVLLACQALAGGFLIDPYRFAAAPSAATITFLQCAESASDLTTYTFAAQNVALGVNLIGISGRDSATVFDITGLTVGGDAATEVIDHTSGVGAVGMYAFLNAAGTSEDIVVTFSEPIQSAAICVAQVNNIQAALDPAFDETPVADTNGGVVTLDTDVPADGIAFGFCGIFNDGASSTWVGLTERADIATFDPAENHVYTAADYDEDSSASTPLAITNTVPADLTLCAVVSYDNG